MLNKITLRETSRLSEAEILLRDIPHDNSAGHLDSVLTKIREGIARVYDIVNCEKKVGVCVSEIHGKEFWILAMYCTTPTDIFANAYSAVAKIAKEKNCTSLVFWTVRAGLIKKALENNFKISHVEMRRDISNEIH